MFKSQGLVGYGVFGVSAHYSVIKKFSNYLLFSSLVNGSRVSLRCRVAVSEPSKKWDPPIFFDTFHTQKPYYWGYNGFSSKNENVRLTTTSYSVN